MGAGKRAAELEKEDLCGFIFKSDSPSSGMERVKVYDANGVPRKAGSGIFARIFMERFPLLPVEEEGRLHDPGLRENFIERIFTCRRWKESVRGKRGPGSLVDFHTKNKLLVMAHSPKHLRLMGQLVARAKDLPAKEAAERYLELLMGALAVKTKPPRNANVLQHMMGYFKKDLAADEKQELLEVIDGHRRAVLPLIVPVTLMNHYVRKYDQPYLKEQTFLNPHPLELQLRNHV